MFLITDTVYQKRSTTIHTFWGVIGLRILMYNSKRSHWMNRIWNVALFQGNGKKRRYFEGWYFKHVSPAGRVFAVIPGIALSLDGRQKQAFIQTIDGNSLKTHYMTFPFEEFSFRRDSFSVSIGANRFSMDGIEVDIGDENFRFSARCSYQGTKGLPFSLINPNAMGWYSFVPFMECYHGLVSMDHEITGYFETDGERLAFDGGRGYIEKDWGRSFPSSWVWMQSNNFSRTGDSFMLSIARIPWLGGHFVGFLGFISIAGEVSKFATYTGARVRDLNISESQVDVVIDAGAKSLSVKGRKRRKGVLKAPVNGVMERRILESIDAEISVEMYDRNGTLAFSDAGVHGGLEIVGEPEELR